MRIHTIWASGGDVHSEQKLPTHMVRGEAATQAVADWLITKHTDFKLKQTHARKPKSHKKVFSR